VYVEQPERALWNFHYIAIPLAALVLEALPGTLVAVFVAAFGVANLRFGAQLPIRTPARAALLIALAIAALAGFRASKASRALQATPLDASLNAPIAPVRVWTLAGAQVIVCVLLALVLLDINVHRRSDQRFGVNQWGFRGALHARGHPGVSLVM